MLFLLIFPTSVYSRNWGHLVTGTTDTLEKKQFTLGSLVTGWGVSDELFVGVSPQAYLGYDFYSFVTRYRYYSADKIKLGIDFFYFDSINHESEESLFEQTSWYFKFNNDFIINEKLKLHFTLGIQYFINENSPYSLRTRPERGMDGIWNQRRSC